MTISITKKLALGILVTGAAVSGLSSSIQAVEGFNLEPSSQAGRPLSSMDNRAESLSDFLEGMTKMQSAYTKAPEHIKPNPFSILNSCIQAMKQTELELKGSAADVVQSQCPVTAEILNAKARFEAGNHYHHINRANPEGADYYAAAALELAGNNDPVPDDYNIVRHIASYILSEPKLSKLPPSADMAQHALRLCPAGADERIALMNDRDLQEEFAKGVVWAFYLEEVLHYPQITFNPAGLQQLKTLMDAIKELGKLGFVDNTGNPFTAVQPSYVDAMIQILGAADAIPTRDSVIMMAALRRREIVSGGDWRAPLT